ncbi:hypothetical protein BJ508DRAFT_344219 [Ascobolus immersus RN42]|uniref:Uncharacterized protein n=1 Tax=Ascobolus immersus RN42 TaxID=1160509 RepID=A0A3N4HAZ6_ASCIM|nr:hypothetical protein BJ508DRAFT_344219 [Ascobolus immersus RN42]
MNLSLFFLSALIFIAEALPQSESLPVDNRPVTSPDLYNPDKRALGDPWAIFCVDANFGGRCFSTVATTGNYTSGCQNLAPSDVKKASTISLAYMMGTYVECIFFKLGNYALLAVPVADGKVQVDGGTEYWAQLCIDAGFQNRCFYTVPIGSGAPSGCQNLAAGDNDKISSIRTYFPWRTMSSTVHECKFYKDINCTGDHTRLTYPDQQLNLAYWRDGTFNDKISSYRCCKGSGCTL